MAANASGRRSSRVSPSSKRSRNSALRSAQLVVGEFLHRRFEGVDVLDDAVECDLRALSFGSPRILVRTERMAWLTPKRAAPRGARR